MSLIKELIKVAKYGFVGLLNTAITALIVFALTSFAIEYPIAQPIAYIIGLVFSFIMNSLFTFRTETRGRLSLKQAVLFFGLGLFLTLIIQITAHIFLNTFLLSPAIVFVINMFIYTGLFFLGSRLFIFTKQKDKSDEA